MIFMDGASMQKKDKFLKILFSTLAREKKNYVHGYNDHKALYKNKIM